MKLKLTFNCDWTLGGYKLVTIPAEDDEDEGLRVESQLEMGIELRVKAGDVLEGIVTNSGLGVCDLWLPDGRVFTLVPLAAFAASEAP